MNKRIQCFTNYPIGQYPHAKLPWEDVYLRWVGKPGQTIYHAAPCLECAAELTVSLKMNAEIRAKYPDGHADDWYREDDARYLKALAVLEHFPYTFYGEGAGLTIVTKAQGFDKWEAERMLAWWLGVEHAIESPKFVWMRPKFVVCPTGFGNYD